MNPRHLLLYLAQEYRREKLSFSRSEIQGKISEIKYLSAQKKVPRMTLRKEILHLEHKLQSVYELEKKLTSKEQKESLKVASLKKQIASLQQRLAWCEEKDLHKKVDRLSYLLGEHQAKKKVAHAVSLHHHSTARKKSASGKVDEISRRLAQAKEKAAWMQENEEIQQKIKLLEEKIQGMKTAPAVIPASEPGEIKHTLKFGSPLIVDKTDAESEKELPLPPPPRMRRK